MKLAYDTPGAKIYEGDARWMNALSDSSIQMVITSPPYFNAREYSQWGNYPDYLADMALVWAECFRVLCDGGRIAVNVPMGYGRPGNDMGGYTCIGDDTTRAIQQAGFELRGHIIWAKNEGISSTSWGSYLSASDPCLRDPHEIIIVAHKGISKREVGENTIDKDTFMKATNSLWIIRPVTSWHPAPFPPEIPRRLIQLYTFKGDTVLDPFSGSGTTVFTAEREKRIGIGIELNRNYIERSVGSMFMIQNP